MSIRIAIWLSALLFSTCAIAQKTYTIDGKQYEDIGYPSNFLVTWALLTTTDANGNTVDSHKAEFKVTAPYAYSSFHVTVTNWFWNWTDHHYGNNGVTRAGSYVDGLTFSATNGSFGWQGSGDVFENYRDGAPSPYFFTVECPEFSKDTEFAVTFDRLLPVPEPDSYAMLLAGLGLVGWIGQRRKQRIH